MLGFVMVMMGMDDLVLLVRGRSDMLNSARSISGSGAPSVSASSVSAPSTWLIGVLSDGGR
jgi:hypothetical protein